MRKKFQRTLFAFLHEQVARRACCQFVSCFRCEAVAVSCRSHDGRFSSDTNQPASRKKPRRHQRLDSPDRTGASFDSRNSPS